MRRQPCRIGLHIDELQQLFGLGMALGFGNAFHLQGKGNVVDDGKMREQGVGLKHHRGVSFGRWQVRHVLRPDKDVAGCRRFMAGHHAQCGCLAAAGRPKQATIGAGGNLEVDGVNGGHSAVFLRQLHQFERRRGRHPHHSALSCPRASRDLADLGAGTAIWN